MLKFHKKRYSETVVYVICMAFIAIFLSSCDYSYYRQSCDIKVLAYDISYASTTKSMNLELSLTGSSTGMTTLRFPYAHGANEKLLENIDDFQIEIDGENIITVNQGLVITC